MPKRKATTQLSGLVGSDDEDVMQMNGGDHSPEPEERAVKRARGRPAKAATAAAAESTQTRGRRAAAAPEEPAKKKRGRPKGSGTRAATEEQELEPEPEPESKQRKTKAQSREPEPEVSSEDEMEQQPVKKTAAAAAAAASKAVAPRGGRKKASTEELEQEEDKGDEQDESEFEYTPRSQKVKSRSSSKVPETQQPDPNTVEESFLPDLPAPPPPRRSGSLSPSKTDPRKRPSLGFSPTKRKTGESTEPELRRKIGELTRKCETLEHRYRSLKEIGVTEATSNVAKLTKQCDTITAASDNLVNSLKEELAAQKALGQQTRLLQKQLSARDAEVAELRSQAEGSAGQLASAQTEVKALQTKLTAARNTAASLESAAAKVPGSAVKGGGNRANVVAAAASTEAAQLKEDLYSDLTGLIIRDVKKGDTETLYDCIQTGVNGTLHFKLSVPHVSSADFESAEFQYVPLLDEDRDRDLVAMLPEYLTVEITFSRQQASKFYTRVIDILTKRRSSNGSSG